ncbi:MAG: Uma2 family endonuclease [Chloroflexota bacterium]|nr:Uma2 family endonuclease [Chloroflexota bacterium]
MATHPQRDELHGIPITEEAFERLVSAESPYHYELIDGALYDMTGSTPEHCVIASNVEFLLREQFGRSGPCRTRWDQYVAIPGKPPVVPDVVLTCDRADWDKDKRLKPCCETNHQIGDGTDDAHVSPSPRQPRLVRDGRASLERALFQGRPSLPSSLSLACGCPAPRPIHDGVSTNACKRRLYVFRLYPLPFTSMGTPDPTACP